MLYQSVASPLSPEGESARFLVVIEVRTTTDTAAWPELSCLVRSYVRVQASRRLAAGHLPPFLPGATVSLADAPPLLRDDVVSVRVCDVSFPTGCPWTNMEQVHFCMRLYRLHGEALCAPVSTVASAPVTQASLPAWCTADGMHSGGDEGDHASAFTLTPLPHISLEGQWESLYYGESEAASIAFKRDIVSYVDTAMRFARAGVSANFVTWNRLILFHGPPGTGKTSLCRALAQKLSIRLTSSLYARACLLEINAHSLFSRWFSESGKRVLQLFEEVHRIADDRDCLVCCVMDEVESLAAARTSALKGNEPSDSIRVVNALLTQMDRLQECENIIVLATTNLTAAIDAALLDRADKRVFVGPPGVQARFLMLQASVQELVAKRLVAAPQVGTSVLPDEPNGLSAAGERGQEGQATLKGNVAAYGSLGSHPLDGDVGTTDAAHMSNEELSALRDVSSRFRRRQPQAMETTSSLGTFPAPYPAHFQSPSHHLSGAAYTISTLLHHIAEVCVGLNGRTLKKLPFLAYGACMCNTSFSGCCGSESAWQGDQSDGGDAPLPLRDYLEALTMVAQEAAAVDVFDSNSGA
ncbi:hypothetical protein CUR178_04548 [Leishmania enriettii]|uniref:AAA+ ATPase domain-containing protein n=1 Tax=Leishmania enriettii TaxID=5663 RepID=A0A836H4S1_LEIEN|nr:hypothetical protein CUR178_04548 [Leishmania enriettii]